MAPNRYYSSNAVETTLTGGISDSATTISVASATGYPGSFPFTVHVDLGNSSEEIMTVTNVSGLNFDVTRGVDGSSAVSHGLGATVIHGVSARDFTEPQAHMDATSGVHGVIGSLNPGRALIKRTATTFNILTGTDNTVTFDAAEYQVGATYWTTGSNVILPANTDVLLHTQVTFQNAGVNAGLRLVQIKRVSDTNNLAEFNGTGTGGSSTDWITVTGTFPYRAAGADSIYLNVKQISAATMTIFQAYLGFTVIAGY